MFTTTGFETTPSTKENLIQSDKTSESSSNSTEKQITAPIDSVSMSTINNNEKNVPLNTNTQSNNPQSQNFHFMNVPQVSSKIERNTESDRGQGSQRSDTTTATNSSNVEQTQPQSQKPLVTGINFTLGSSNSVGTGIFGFSQT
jgi:hypothetical protein